MRQGILIREWLVVEDELGWASDSPDSLELFELPIVKVVNLLPSHHPIKRLSNAAR